jgi:hypothetical protein
MATVLLYLSEVEEGGETVFKKEGEDGEEVHCCVVLCPAVSCCVVLHCSAAVCCAVL